MIDRSEATQLISGWLADHPGGRKDGPIELCLLEEETLETDFGWVFFYDSKRFLETREFQHAIAGNAPVIVDRTVGSLHITGTARPIERCIDDFRQRRAMIGLSTASFVGQPIDDDLMMARLPRDYAEFLWSVNGCVVFGGGLHIRGCTKDPDWHSLQRMWIGDSRLSALYPAVQADDIPFAQDCFGDQFLLRSKSVYRLSGETGDLENLGLGWQEFLTAAAANPVEFLSLQLLEQFRRDGGSLEPGQLLSVYPPLCIEESANGVSLRAISATDRIGFLADLAAQISNLPDGAQVRFDLEGRQSSVKPPNG